MSPASPPPEPSAAVGPAPWPGEAGWRGWLRFALAGALPQALAGGLGLFAASVLFGLPAAVLLRGPRAPAITFLLEMGLFGLVGLAAGTRVPARAGSRGALAYLLAVGAEVLLEPAAWRALTPAYSAGVTAAIYITGAGIGALCCGVLGLVGRHLAAHDLRAWLREEVEEFLESLGLRPGPDGPAEEDDAPPG
jgi:hypothetical protein